MFRRRWDRTDVWDFLFMVFLVILGLIVLAAGFILFNAVLNSLMEN